MRVFGHQAQCCLGGATGLETRTENGTKCCLECLRVLAVLWVLHESIIGNDTP